MAFNFISRARVAGEEIRSIRERAGRIFLKVLAAFKFISVIFPFSSQPVTAMGASLSSRS